ncbi:unnamed protein product [Didymodactylos carnosus]|uniref:Uncharacterized protein n=1 Tax=Didymodactylos carnosus TaxID=1234261 RepID=A0A8S2SY65_9BILA|nr:unnamed protein product [Didymodactylos carnosus]CAF4255536.1 unnamed protein product [Didymodactylos carnosus]
MKWSLKSSPDGIIDYIDTDGKGLLEIKCSYSKRDKAASEACEDPQFYRLKDDKNNTLLKTTFCSTFYETPVS